MMDAKFFQNVAIEDVRTERMRQDTKWGPQNHQPYKWLAILGEEVGEACTGALNDDMDNFREELVQVAAVAIAAIECLDRNKKEGA